MTLIWNSLDIFIYISYRFVTKVLYKGKTILIIQQLLVFPTCSKVHLKKSRQKSIRYNFSTVSMGTRSKVAHMHQFLDSNDPTDIGDGAEQVIHRQSFQESRSVKQSISDHALHSSVNVSGDNLSYSTHHNSVIIQTNCGFLNPIPSSIRSPQIEIF